MMKSFAAAALAALLPLSSHASINPEFGQPRFTSPKPSKPRPPTVAIITPDIVLVAPGQLTVEFNPQENKGLVSSKLFKESVSHTITCAEVQRMTGPNGDFAYSRRLMEYQQAMYIKMDKIKTSQDLNAIFKPQNLRDLAYARLTIEAVENLSSGYKAAIKDASAYCAKRAP